ncbi:TetR/AcrR family transcriptional regulator [uncultured Brachybacterium sp.]|uniref:TetR/AcrR family transcriptional regulator n=1 Tax=uncultured Brachybacterium sp. TaxID=189680 RepID=UPI0026311038|nr:TetR/AcrR family transcriptional regulator [uncultured Brachybacterium sp.]
MPSTSDRAPDPRPARTRAAIFSAARDLTSMDGEVTVNALAKRAGVSRAAFYSHFSGLDELMGAMFQQMFDAAWARGRAFAVEKQNQQDAVQFGFGMFVAYVERHHAFLRGALDWKFSHRTYMILVDKMTMLHGEAFGYLGDQVPERLRTESTGRSIAGSELALAAQWLVETEQQAAEGAPLDATSLLEKILTFAPSWYTGIGPEDPIAAGELLALCRAAGEAAED